MQIILVNNATRESSVILLYLDSAKSNKKQFGKEKVMNKKNKRVKENLQ